jgi:uncharacterized membrane protein
MGLLRSKVTGKRFRVIPGYDSATLDFVKDMLMQRKRHSLALFAAAAAVAAALGAAPMAAAEPGADNPLLPGCEVTGGSTVIGGQNTDCASPGNVQIDATPNDLGVIGGEMDEPMFGMIGW